MRAIEWWENKSLWEIDQEINPLHREYPLVISLAGTYPLSSRPELLKEL